MTPTEEPISEGKQYGNEFMSNYYMSTIFTRISTTSPFIIFPLLSLYFHNWYLLFGILFCLIGGFLSINKVWVIIVFVLTILYWVIVGFIWKSYVNVFFLCYLYGHITFYLGKFFIDKFEGTKTKIKEQGDIQFDKLREDLRKRDLQ